MAKGIQQKSSKRSMRRHHRQRMIQRARSSLALRHYSIDERIQMARKLANHLKICSCEHSCGNIRHNRWSSGSERLTRQENRSILDMFEQMSEVFNVE